jgi:predicted transcriptional regulator YheO
MRKNTKQAAEGVRQEDAASSVVEQTPKRKIGNSKKVSEPFWQKLAIALVAIIPSFITGVSMGSCSITPAVPPKSSLITGRPLATYECYPVVADQTGALRLDLTLFSKCIRQVLDNNDRKAAADLFYLGEHNHVTLELNPDSRYNYERLRMQFDLIEFEDVNKQRDVFFEVYKDIVNGIGQTFAGTPIEIVLHDIRDPLHSIVAIQNPISGRKLRDPTTNFGIQLIKDYSSKNEHMASYISYPLKMKNGREIKSTTIPLYHPEHGLIGFVCMNIDTSRLKQEATTLLNDTVKKFIDQFAVTYPNEDIDELIENSKQK